MKTRKNKKGQEEVFGFVIIVLIVIIMGVVFFAFSLRRPSQAIDAKKPELSDLIQAMLSYTTECKIGVSEQNIRELIRECYNNPLKICGNGNNGNEQVCSVLNTNLETMLDQFLGKDIAQADVHGYVLNISNAQQITNIENGQLEGNYFGSSVPIPTLHGEDVIVKLRFYYSED